MKENGSQGPYGGDELDEKEHIDPDEVSIPRFTKKQGSRVELDGKGALKVDQPLIPLIDPDDDYLILGRSGSSHRKWGRRATLEIGAVYEHQTIGEDHFSKRVVLDCAYPHIMFICGKRGSGKSYTLGILAEELVRSQIGVGVVLIDPIGIFWSLKQENTSIREREELSRWGLSPHDFPEVKVVTPEGSLAEGRTPADGPFSIGIGEMTAEDWCQVFDLDRFKTQGLLIGTALDMINKGYQAVREGRIVRVPGRGNRYSIGDIVDCIQGSLSLTSKESGFNPQTRRSIVARFNAASKWGIFSVDGTPLREIISPNRITILDVSDPRLGDAKRSLITGILARKVLSARIHSARLEDRGQYDSMDPDTIPVTWLLIDEAHVILPHGKQTPASDALVEYAKQGRRPGCAMVLATQRPAATNDDILSQVDLIIGHNLALEDDMTALRRRVPAKLPPEFANSDFIRAIPVGTAVIADQRTQQRSFLIKLRPRMSHHSGSSAMPRALSEPVVQPVRPVAFKGEAGEKTHPVGEPTPVPSEDGYDTEQEEIYEDADLVREVREKEEEKDRMKEEREGWPMEDIGWGSTVLLMGHSVEDLSKMLKRVREKASVAIFSRTPPEKYTVPEGLDLIHSSWLSSTHKEGSIAPTDIQDISLQAGKVLSRKDPVILVLDGLEHIYTNNGKEPMRRLLQVLHERAYIGRHLLLLRVDQGIDEKFNGALRLESDHILEAEAPPDKGVKGTLSRGDLERMCEVLGLSGEGSEDELITRILDHRGSDGDRPTGFVDPEKENRMEEVLEQARGFRKENENLKKRLEELEKSIRIESDRKGKKKDKTVVIWEMEGDRDEKKRIRKQLGRLIKEVSHLKSSIREGPSDTSKGVKSRVDPSFIHLLGRIEEERNDSIRRLRQLEEELREGLSRLKEKEERLEGDGKSGIRKKVKGEGKITDGRKMLPPSKKEKTHLKARTVKKGVEAVVIAPRATKMDAKNSARKTIKRSLFRGPRERIDDIIPIYLPILRFRVSYRSGLLGGIKEGDLFVDGITGEVIESAKGGLSRSIGMEDLVSMTGLEKSVFSAVGRGKREDTRIARKAGLKTSSARRALTSLVKKGILRKEVDEGNIDLYSLSPGIHIPSKPWKRDPGLHPRRVEGIEEDLIDPIIDKKRMDMTLSVLGDIKPVQTDTIYYPFFAVCISGEGRRRWVAVDGVSGKLDKVLSPFIKEIMVVE